MTASNLSICVGPSLIWTQDQAYMMDQNYSKEVSALVQILIEQYTSLYGDHTPHLFCEDKVEARQDKRMVEAAGGGGPAERTSSLSSTKSENTHKPSKKGKYQKHFHPSSILPQSCLNNI